MISYLEKFNLRGKKAVVTGGAGLIGRETVKALASSGAEVAIADLNQEVSCSLVEELKSNDFKALYYNFDTTDIANLEKNINQLTAKIGRIDIWVNCAYPRTEDFACPVEEINFESWRKNVDMHLNSYALVSKYVAEKMKKNGGTIINFASIYGVVGNDPNIYKGTDMHSSMAYTAIKGGIVNLTRYLAAYFGKYNIRVNSICPGGVFNNQHPVFVENYSKRVPLKRMAESEDIASVVLFMASEAAAYMTGATVMVDGGWTCI